MNAGNRKSNAGQVGIDSIRIGGLEISELPMIQAAHAKQQLPLAIDNQKKQKIKEVLKRFPTQKVPYLEGVIKECQNNIRTQTNFKAELAQKIAGYEGQRNFVQYGKEQLLAIDPQGEIASFFGRIGAEQIKAKKEGREPEVPDVSEEMYAKYEQIKAIRTNYPPYNQGAMDAQIQQFREGINACDTVIQKEYFSIAEFTGVLSLCQQRDSELKALGVVVSKHGAPCD